MVGRLSSLSFQALPALRAARARNSSLDTSGPSSASVLPGRSTCRRCIRILLITLSASSMPATASASSWMLG